MQFDVAGLQQMLLDLGEKHYRARQLAEWLYLRGAEDFASMDTLPRALRAALAERFVFSQPRILQKLVARDGTLRYLLELSDGVKTETVAISSGRRLTVCFSTQAGCALGCVFCATGRMGLGRSLLPGEMLSQLAVVAADAADVRASNVVAMGQGEPFANYDATLSALRMMNSPELFGIGGRHITVSTAGLVRPLRRFASEPEQFTLAVSLHSAEQHVRDLLMPGLKSQPLNRLREALLFYMESSSRRPSLEYALIEGVNDSEQALASLLAFCRAPAPGFHVNLLTLNADGLARPLGREAAGSVEGEGLLQAPNPEEKQRPLSTPSTGLSPLSMAELPLLKKAGAGAFRRFEQGLNAAGVSVSRRVSRGASINAACGQLACSTSEAEEA
ncbi:MAG: 23S rRNA (adenine(2503)-C(2))-methyltransferase RlmN [Coriobacteriales bacterium]|jgi:23S rRNA (adenine2503-C2)-methyltransferase|nr:23S rRNA (adenine(2503)-C(2))-methyltransferase RlmN [Coriobacteriales bacterium]